MRRVLPTIFAAAMIGSASIAGAADIPVKAPTATAPQYIPPQYNWTGFYFGVAGGGGWGSSKHTSPLIPIAISGTFDVDGGIVGGTAGFNWQNGPIVFGIEGDLSASWIEGSTRGVSPLFCPPGGAAANCSTELEWLGTVRGRIGPAWGAFLPYATGGVAFGSVHGSTDNGRNSGSDTRVGWTAGGGLEMMLAPNWTGKVEYLYVDLGTEDSLFIRQPGAFPFDVSFKAHILRAGLNFKFGL